MRLAERTSGGLHAHLADRIVRSHPDRGLRILDLGCGTGAFLVRLQQAGYRALTGADIAPPIGLPEIRCLKADLDRFQTDLADASVDLVVAVEVFEHVENLGSLLDELARVLVPGGQVLMTTPNLHSLEARLRFLLTGHLKQFDALGDPTHITPLFRHPFEKLLGRHGFAVLEQWGFPEDGSSPTSRPALRQLARMARLLGVAGQPAGDQLCLLLQRQADWTAAAQADRKRDDLTAHYRS